MYLSAIGLLIMIISSSVILYTFVIPGARSEKMIDWSYSLLTEKEKKNCLIALLTFFLILIILITFSSDTFAFGVKISEIKFVEQIAKIIGALSYCMLISYIFYFFIKKNNLRKKMTQENIKRLEIIVKRLIFSFLIFNFCKWVLGWSGYL